MSAQTTPYLKRLPLPLATLLLASLMLTGASCAPSQDQQGAADGVSAAPADPPPPVRDVATAPREAPPMSDPLPPMRVPEPDAENAPRAVAPGATVEIDTRCTRDADCTIKDVGNCCGYYPACVNVDSPTDPAAVQAQCASQGTMSVCGFPSISACQCVAGQCQAASATVDR